LAACRSLRSAWKIQRALAKDERVLAEEGKRLAFYDHPVSNPNIVEIQVVEVPLDVSLPEALSKSPGNLSALEAFI